ncbi:hypothetical protein CIG75_14180 [Tumebacillus algifaecis]|uniref:GerMN domain-containing protein n=1 Tax=Tumebacillus algifaecis TaxID=1214604 RepID=A0A223D3K8_9BACL|nr:GerMN domain-containing protein [Tumebacillus algifaecis]ASS75997.1 hypothetical protein CIG75_14180 [Tumebacillus algifaecis]
MKKRMLGFALLIGASLVMTACGSSQTAKQPAQTPEQQQPAGSQSSPSVNRDDVPDASKEEITVYRGNQDGTAVVKEKHSIAKMESKEKKMTVLFNLLQESGQNSAPSVPKRVQLKSAVLAGDVLTLDLSQDVQSMSSTEETIFMEALPSTVFDNLTDVNTIKFKINGEDAQALSQMDVSKGIARK